MRMASCFRRSLPPIAFLTGIAALGGCRESTTPTSNTGQPSTTAPRGAKIGPETSAVPIDLTKGWCAGHGVPESVCTRCNSSLIPQFKAAGDWCA